MLASEIDRLVTESFATDPARRRHAAPGLAMQLDDDRAAVAAIRLLADAQAAAAMVTALLNRGDALGVMFVLGGLQNADDEAREAIEEGVFEHIQDADDRRALFQHLTMARIAADPQTAETADRLLADASARTADPA